MLYMKEQFTIGQVAKKTGITIDTLRYYERIGLLPGVERTNGQRRFNVSHIQRIQFIQRAQNMDFSLKEIGQLLMFRESPEASKTEVREMASDKLKEIQERLEVLLTLQQELTELVDECKNSTSGPCPIIQSLDQPLDQPQQGRSTK